MTTERAARAAVAIAAVGLSVAGCAATSGTPTAAEPVIDVFEGRTGDYSIIPPTVDDPRTEEQGIVMESMRLGNAVINPADADPTLDDNWLPSTGLILDPAEATGEGGLEYNFFADVAEPILEKYGMLGGYAVSGGDIPLTADNEVPPGATSITATIIRFPNADAARNAAREIDAADTEYGGPENEKVEIPGYPEANSHWRPNYPSLAATTAHGEFVVDVFAFRPAPDKASLTALVRKVYDMQLPRLDEFDATPADEIADLPVDPDGLFARSLVPHGEVTVDGRSIYAFDLGGLAHVASKETVARLRQPMTDAGVTAIVDAGNSTVVRTRDTAAADKLTATLATGDDRTSADAPAEIANNAACYERTDSVPNDTRYGCYVHYRAYVAGVTGETLDDVHDRAFAQLAVMLNSELG